MKVLTGIAACTLMITLSACGPNARDLELKRLTKVVETLQGQMVSQDQRIEALTDKMIVMKQARIGFDSSAHTMQPELQVVRLTPERTDNAEETGDSVDDEEPIVLTLRGTPEEPPLAVVAVAPPPVHTRPAQVVQSPERRLFIRALEHHGAGELDKAGILLEKLLGQYPQSNHAPSAHYWLGECHYESSRPQVAIVHYERVFTDYPKHTKAAGALLKTGLSYKNMKRVDDARTTFSVLLSRYPQSAEAELARAHLGSIQGGGS
ncbi:MAG: tetratricopeptide repeat protein [Deltaproteobacteria bacterium]|nr:tetratricopeptide repeat protein [Deltaproteobacteria bacterium]MBT6435577.1 tetratricopeptide repeat protein [Deltaproteobacteria bacterium]MBT6489825.1 tetratricopeptide repeat protein [Deltaproteobacteria bacterium]